MRTGKGVKNYQTQVKGCHHFAVMLIENGLLQTKYIYVQNLCNAKDPFCSPEMGVNQANCPVWLQGRWVRRAMYGREWWGEGGRT